MTKDNCKKSILLTIVIICCFGCVNDQRYYSSHYNKIEFYCMCFVFDSRGYQKSDGPGMIHECETISTVPPGNLIKPKFLYDSLKNVEKINAIANLIFNEKESVTKINAVPDSRFILLLRKDDMESDTLVFQYPYKFVFNSRQIFGYSFNIMDSIRKIIGQEKLDCQEK